jgi:uncharacterized integral membrane protein
MAFGRVNRISRTNMILSIIILLVLMFVIDCAVAVSYSVITDKPMPIVVAVLVGIVVGLLTLVPLIVVIERYRR